MGLAVSGVRAEDGESRDASDAGQRREDYVTGRCGPEVHRIPDPEGVRYLRWLGIRIGGCDVTTGPRLDGRRNGSASGSGNRTGGAAGNDGGMTNGTAAGRGGAAGTASIFGWDSATAGARPPVERTPPALPTGPAAPLSGSPG